jgi:hypothetical protein
MKNKNLYLIILFLLGMTSCKNDLDLKTDNSYGDDLTWKLPDKAEGVLLKAYEGLMLQPDGWAGNNFLDAATDDAVTNDFGSGIYNLTAGDITAQNNPIGNWSAVYLHFQNIHLFLEKGLVANIIYDLADPKIDKAKRNRLKGEAYFLRAWWGFELLQNYGGLTNDGKVLGYPIILKSLSNADLSMANSMKRNTYEECISQIANDCDTAIKYLPNIYAGTDGIIGSSQVGRASGKAAYGLKSRLYTYAASPAYQPAGMSSADLNNKWILAAQTSQNAITKGALGAFTPLVEAYLSGSTLQAATPDEFLLRTWSNTNAMEKREFPPYFYGQGKTNPSQNLVDAFPMLVNGFPITDPRSGYNPQNPYFNRDKRLDLTVYYHGRTFNTSRPLEIAIDEAGYPGREAPGYEYRNTRTGYYVRKWMSTKLNMLYDPTTLAAVNDYHQYPLLRKAEIYYNLAEALNEAVGPTGVVSGSTLTAVSILNTIRAANGITSTVYVSEVAAKGKTAFRNLILNERRIEFAFENRRYFDLRRWLLPLNESVRGTQITKTPTGVVYKGTIPAGEAVVVEKRLLDNAKYYYMPIPYDEIVKNPALIQNKGW